MIILTEKYGVLVFFFDFVYLLPTLQYISTYLDPIENM